MRMFLAGISLGILAMAGCTTISELKDFYGGGNASREQEKLEEERHSYIEESERKTAALEHMQKEVQKEASERRLSYLKKNPGLSPIIKKAIREGEVMIGMSASDVRASWGDPKRINKTVYSYGTHEQWVYNNNEILYMRNGKLDSIQQTQ